MARKHTSNQNPAVKKPTPVTRNGFIDSLKQVIEYVENCHAPFSYYVATFLAAITLRIFLEIMVVQNDTRIFWHTPIHFALFYASLMLHIILLLFLMTNEKIEKISKLVMTGFIVTATVPVTDLLFQLVWQYEISYLYMVPEKTKSIWTNYLLFFGDHKGATPGMRIEILAAMAGGGLYVYTKTNSKIRGVVTAVLIYSLIFWLYGAIIFLITGLERLAGLPYDTSYTMMIHAFLFLLFHSLLLAAYCYNPEYFKAILKDFRLTRVLHYVLMVLFGIVIGYAPSSTTVLKLSHFIEMYFIVIAVICACILAGAIGHNNRPD